MRQYSLRQFSIVPHVFLNLTFVFLHEANKPQHKSRNFLKICILSRYIYSNAAVPIGHFRAPQGLCIETRLSAQPLIWKSLWTGVWLFFSPNRELVHRLICKYAIFHSHANKTHFHKKGCALGLILKRRVFGTRNRPITVYLLFRWA